MKKIFIAVFLCAIVFARAMAQASGNPVVVIAPFEAQGVQAEEANVITEMFTSEYATTGLANVVDRNSFDKIKKELSFQASDWSNSDKVAELGKALNANQVVVGTITSFREQVIVSIKVIDINSTTILASHVEKLRAIDGIVGRMPKICKTLASKARTANKNGFAKSSTAITSRRNAPIATVEEKTHSFYISPVIGYDSFILANTCTLGVDFKYKHKSGVSVWANNAVLLGRVKYSHVTYRFTEKYYSNGKLYDRYNDSGYHGSDELFFSAGVSTEIMLGYSKVFGSHGIGIGAGYQGAVTKHFSEAYAFAFRFEYSYGVPQRNVGFIMAITDGIGYIKHKGEVGEVRTDNVKFSSGYYIGSDYTAEHNVDITKKISANNRFSLKLGVVFTP